MDLGSLLTGVLNGSSTPTKMSQSSTSSTSIPFSSPSSIESPKGSHKRKTQPRKRIIIDEEQGSVSYMDEMKASSSREEEDEHPDHEGMDPLIGMDDPIEIFNRLTRLLGDEAVQQILSSAIQPPQSGTPPPIDNGALSAFIEGGEGGSRNTIDTMHPMIQAAAFAGIQNTNLANLLTPPMTRTKVPKSEDREDSMTPQEASSSSSNLISFGLAPSQSARTLTLKRKLFDNNKDQIRAATTSITHEERVDLDDLENFAQLFKKQRIKFGFTQGDVGQALGKRYGTDFSQTTISRFEALNLSFKNMCKLRPLLKEWLSEAELAMANGATPADLLERAPGLKQSTPVSSEESKEGEGIMMGNILKKRRKRTNLDNTQKLQLDDEFDRNPRPNHCRMAEIATQLDLDRDVVRVWFCNRRQKVRKMEDERITLESASMALSQRLSHLTGQVTTSPSFNEGTSSFNDTSPIEPSPAPSDPIPTFSLLSSDESIPKRLKTD